MTEIPSGFLLIDKPTTWTSHDVVGYLRGFIRKSVHQDYPDIRNIKVGHAGTLDPFATGLLIVGVGRPATKRLDEFKDMKKEYIATIQLGATSTTYDPEGEITQTKKTIDDTVDVQKIISSFIGKQAQLPPMYSAKKIGGKKLYDLARQGIEIERNTHEVEIYNIDLLEVELQQLKIRVSCSTGTYIRTLAHDIGQKLGVGAYCEELRRTKIGEYSVEDASGPKELSRETWQERLVQA